MDNGEARALRVFRQAVRDVPAYADFLRSRRVRPGNIRTIRDFRRLVPLTDKKSYVQKYPLRDLFPRRIVPPFAYASSGSSGVPTFWFRGDAEEERGADVHERIFRDVFGMRKDEPTLVVVCFSTGVWIAGGFTTAACRAVSRRGYRITTVTPGLERGDIRFILARLAPRFKTVILAGYPPFLLDILRDAKREKIALPRRLFAISSGEKFSESWRRDFLKLSGARSPSAIVSIYGSADAGAMGFETPFTIQLRRHADASLAFARAFFGQVSGKGEATPLVAQFDPNHIWFEESNGELALTALTAAPLIRYNIHDHGRVLSVLELRRMLQSANAPKLLRRMFLSWKLPCVVKGGRSDVAVTFYALNIYPENIVAGLATPTVRRLVTGQFFAFRRRARGKISEQLRINVELAPRVSAGKRLAEIITESIVRRLAALNIEYRKLLGDLGDQVRPIVHLVRSGTGEFKERGVRGMLRMTGRKPRIAE